MSCISFLNTCPASADTENVLLAKLLQVLNDGGSSGGAGVSSLNINGTGPQTGAVSFNTVTSLDVNGGGPQTGDISITIPGALKNFTDENSDADGVMWRSAGTVETLRSIGATGFLSYNTLRIHNVNDTTQLAITGGTSKSDGSYMSLEGENAVAGGSFGVAVKTTGNFHVISQPPSSLVPTFRFIVDGATGDTTVSTGRFLIPNTTSSALGGIYFGGVLSISNFGTDNIFVGKFAGNLTLTGVGNVGIGVGALFSNTTGTRNVAIGRDALLLNTTGLSNMAIGYSSQGAGTTGGANVSMGDIACLRNVTGNNNTCVGYGAGTGVAGNSFSDNTFIGHRAGEVITTGSSNILIGSRAGDNLTTGANNIVIGAAVDSPIATNSNTLTIGNAIFGTGLSATGTTIAPAKIGIGVITPPETLSIAATVGNATFALYGTTTVTTNYTRLNLTTQAGNYRLWTEAAGTGLASGQPPILQVGTGPSVGTDIAGQSVLWHSGQGTGTGTGGSHLFQVSAPGATSATVQALATRLTLNTTDLIMATAVRLAVATGANQRAGNATLIAGSITVANTSVTANTIVLYSRKTSGGTIGTAMTYTVSAATSFTLTSDSALDTSTFSYFLIEVP